MSYYYANKERSRTKNTKPTLTDQAGAKDTDINVIVSRFTKTGTVPGTKTAPMSGDFTQLPRDLAEFIQTSRNLQTLTRKLPKELQDMKIEDMLALTPEQLKEKLAPPPAPPPPDNKDGDKK